MISADHPRFSCTSDMSLTIYGKIFSGPLHTNDPSGTVFYVVFPVWYLYCDATNFLTVQIDGTSHDTPHNGVR